MASSPTSPRGASSTGRYVLFVVAVVIVAILIAIARRHGPAPEQAPQEAAALPSYQLPEGFPIDLPQEEGAVVTENTAGRSSDGRFQGARSYVSAKSVEDNAGLYRDYFDGEGWTLRSEASGSGYAALLGAKDGMELQVSINSDQAGSLVALTVVQSQPEIQQ